MFSIRCSYACQQPFIANTWDSSSWSVFNTQVRELTNLGAAPNQRVRDKYSGFPPLHFPDIAALLSLLPNGNLLTDLELAFLPSRFYFSTYQLVLSGVIYQINCFIQILVSGSALGETQYKTVMYSFSCHWTCRLFCFSLLQTRPQHSSTNFSRFM